MAKILIFGATSAIASSAATLWVARGDSLFLVGRNPNKLQAILDDLRVRKVDEQIVEGAVADLDDFAQHGPLIALARETLGGLDVALIAQGSLPDQKACESSVEATLAEIRTNALGPIALLTLLAGEFERARSALGPEDEGGVIAVIGSVAGDRGRQSNYVYGAAKGMLATFLEGLRNRLAKVDVAVVTIKPGFVDTPMTASFDKKGPLWASSQTVAKGVVSAIERRRDVVYLPGFWRFIMFVIRHIPEFVFKRLSL